MNLMEYPVLIYYLRLKNGNNIINNDNDFILAGSLNNPNDAWVDL